MEGLKQIADRLGEKMTSLIKEEIKRQGLISNDPPHLYDSIQASVTVTNDSFSVKIKGYDYFKYLNAKYHIMDNVKKTSGYQEMIKDVAEFFAKNIAKEIKDKIKK